MVIKPEERLHVLWDGYSAFAGVERRVGDGADDRIRCLLKYGFGNGGIMADGKKFDRAYN